MNNFEKDFLIELIEYDRFIDSLLEKALQKKLSLPNLLNILLKEFIKLTNIEAGFIYTYDENLNKRFFYKGDKNILEKFNFKMFKDITAPLNLKKDKKIIILQPIDIAGEKIGVSGFVFSLENNKYSEKEYRETVKIFTERLDNYLFENNNARKKQNFITKLNIKLRNPILSEGLSDSVSILNEEVNFKELALIYKNIEDNKTKWNYKIFKGNALIYDNTDKKLINREISDDIKKIKDQDISGYIPKSFKEGYYIESTLITGHLQNEILGKIIITSEENKGFNTYSRDLISVFSQTLTYRFLDFTKEIKKLRRYFSVGITSRLLSYPDYNERYLQPTIKDCLILFTDINGFTKISEKVFSNPTKLGKFIDHWSGEVIDIIYRYDGVFDKMVGDCIIGIFGPPFFDKSKSELIKSAINAIKEINDFTVSLEEKYPNLKSNGEIKGLGVATGLNWTPLNVGFFCRYEDYTGFSSGMNNTARLQALAGFRETYIMDNLYDTLCELIKNNEFDFDITIKENRKEPVKNVEKPLSFYPIEFK